MLKHIFPEYFLGTTNTCKLFSNQLKFSAGKVHPFICFIYKTIRFSSFTNLQNSKCYYLGS